MTRIQAQIEQARAGALDQAILHLYRADYLEAQRSRCIHVMDGFASHFEDSELLLFSAPGRTEIGGNHTDHQHGCVLAAGIDRDTLAAVSPVSEAVITLISEGYAPMEVSLDTLSPVPSEVGTSVALIRGVAAGFLKRGYRIGGFKAYVQSEVPSGAGLSSSAAFETLIGTIFSFLYNDGVVPPKQIAIIGQEAENVFFGKPCGLMDQMACSLGSLVAIDFADPTAPKETAIPFDFSECGFNLCITNCGGSHADLTDDYASIPVEMKLVASEFGEEVLRRILPEQLLNALPSLYKKVPDRAILRSIHFVQENQRAQDEAAALLRGDLTAFLNLVQASGNSSFQFLQNVYAPKRPEDQSLAVALAATQLFLNGQGAYRVHGGGFAGTIQAFVPMERTESYQMLMNGIFGEGACHILSIRPVGGVKLEFGGDQK